MRVMCPNCHRRHDVSARDVLREAERLKLSRTERPAMLYRPGPDMGPDEADLDAVVNGNVLVPEDAEAVRMRDESIRRRMAR